ncbi:hypothetical protein Theth_1189 [Pseudothermotoga thermarum DSM 5069]|uniref:Uncharacterized protein n=1 Tax=Pseudothermotoga thermarum DSM 5069 TaxID=688269 RepID=F7YTN9_9THEM|nr:hypothetical protein Theth_1189 [Pseudothermotoga thermarum DSM 5069]
MGGEMLEIAAELKKHYLGFVLSRLKAAGLSEENS